MAGFSYFSDSQPLASATLWRCRRKLTKVAGAEASVSCRAGQVCVDLYIRYRHTFMYISVYVYTELLTYMHIHRYTQICEHTYTYLCMHVCMNEYKTPVQIAAACAMLAANSTVLLTQSGLVPRRLCSLSQARSLPRQSKADFAKSQSHALRNARCLAAAGAALTACRARRYPRRETQKSEAVYVSLDDPSIEEPLQEPHLTQLETVFQSLVGNGMGVIPTDTQHAYVTPLNSKSGVRRIYDIKGIDKDERLSCLKVMFYWISIYVEGLTLDELPTTVPR